MKEFSTAKMDQWTIFYTVLAACAMVFAGFLGMDMGGKYMLGVFLFAVLIFSVSYAFVPKITVDRESIIIKHFFSSLSIDFKSIKNVEIQKGKRLNFRKFGIGGIFGFFGYFNNWDELWFVTNCDKKIRITTDKRKFVISPEEFKEFLQYIQPYLKNNL